MSEHRCENTRSLSSRIPQDRSNVWALACEIGSVTHAEDPSEDGQEKASTMELVRLAIPHRVYTQSHIDHIVEAILQVYERRASISGYRIVSQPKFLRHFTARFEPLQN